MAELTFDAAASAYDRMMGRWSRLYIPALLAAARVAQGGKVLDVATGTGEAALMAAARVGASGSVVGCDVSVPMLSAATRKTAGTPIRLIAADGQALPCRDHAFDAVICQLGLMFFPDAALGLREFRRVLRPGGRMAACVWSTPERAPFISFMAEAMARQFPARREDLMAGLSLSDPRLLHDLIEKAGFHDARVTGEARQIAFESFDDYWEPIEAGGARSGALYRSLSPDARGVVKAEVRERLARFESRGRLVMDAEALLASGNA